jgi:hypothetical protein
MALTPGTQLGFYQVLSQIDAGENSSISPKMER